MNGFTNVLGKLVGVAILLGFFFGLIVVAFAPFEILRKADAETWPSRKGIITQSQAGKSRSRSGARVYTSWEPAICGTYRDNGERFCISHVRYGHYGWEASAREAAAKYPVGREVDVYFSPDDPKETVLEAISPWTEAFTVLGLGIGLLLLPVFLWLSRTNRAA